MIGGGPAVATTFITTMVTDVVPPRLRSTVFFYRFCCDQFADLIVPPIALALMESSIWRPLIAVVVLQGVSLLVALILPETLPESNREVIDEGNSGGPSDTRDYLESRTTAKLGKLSSWLRATTTSFEFITQNGTLAILVVTFLVSKLGRQANAILLQYASIKYGWSLSKVFTDSLMR